MKEFFAPRKISKSLLQLSVITGLFLGGTFSLGYFLERDGEIRFNNIGPYLLWICSAVVITVLIIMLFSGLDYSEYRNKENGKSDSGTKMNWKIVYFFLVFCYSVSFLGVFPGFFAYDATMAHRQFFYDNITSQHPWIHTIILGYIAEFSKSHLGHPNVGIAIYIYTQMLFVAGCFTYTLYSMEKYICKRVVVIISMVFYAIFPTIHMFALCSTKDTLFTALLVLFMVMLNELFIDTDNFLHNKLKLIVFVLSAVGFLILRKNAFYAMLVFVPVFLYFMRRNFKKAFMMVGAIWIIYWIYSVPLTNAMGIIDIGPQEALSVPSQQIARVYNQNRDVMTEEEVKAVECFYQKELFEMYLPKLADYTKGGLNRTYFEEHVKEYIQLWLSLGVKAPDEYINSFLVNNYGFWYPYASLDGYRGYVGMQGTVLENAEVFYFAYVTEEPGERISLIPFIDRAFFDLSTMNLHKKLPVVSLLFSPGFMFWIMIITIAYTLYKKRYELMPMFILMSLVWLTVLLGPIALVRYVLFLFFAFPLMLSALFKREIV